MSSTADALLSPPNHGPVALLGAGGAMGGAMARSLTRAGIQVRAWNRTPEKLEPPAAEGMRVLDGEQDVIATYLTSARRGHV